MRKCEQCGGKMKRMRLGWTVDRTPAMGWRCRDYLKCFHEVWEDVGWCRVVQEAGLYLEYIEKYKDRPASHLLPPEDLKDFLRQPMFPGLRGISPLGR